jgi:hypothetical protein
MHELVYGRFLGGRFLGGLADSTSGLGRVFTSLFATKALTRKEMFASIGIKKESNYSLAGAVWAIGRRGTTGNFALTAKQTSERWLFRRSLLLFLNIGTGLSKRLSSFPSLGWNNRGGQKSVGMI